MVAVYSIKPKSSHRRRLALSSLLFIVLTAGVVVWCRQVPSTASPARSTPPSTLKTAVTSLQGRYLFTGTTVWARQVERGSQRPDGSYDYNHPFSQLDTFNRPAYDAWTTDFECPITNNTVPYDVQTSQLVFNCRPEFLSAATKYFNFFDLANNHTDNQGGAAGLAGTRQHLQAAGVQYFGTFDPSKLKDDCEVVGLPVRLQKADGSQTKADLPVAMCAWHYFYRQPLPGEIEVMHRYAQIVPVFAFVEMGAEYHPQADVIQQSIAHKIVDQGPEFVIANNPHWVQNAEVYKGKLIVYSTGNFIFDQIDAETMRSASIDVSITTDYNQNVQAWLKLGQQCKTFQDNCLEQAEKTGLKKINLQLHYGVVAGQGGAHELTHKADAATQRAVEDRLNWVQALKELSQKQ